MRSRVAAGVLGAAALGFVAGRSLPTASAEAPDEYAGLDLYARVLGQIQRSALTPPSLRELVYASLRGMASSIDAHTVFYDPPAWARMEAEAAGTWVGIGVASETAPCGQRVTRTVAGGPAERAGVGAGDCLVAVDGAPLAGLDGETATGLLRGDVDTEATLTVEPAGAPTGTRRRVAVLRARVVEASVTTDEPAPGVRRLAIREIREHTVDEVRTSAAGASALMLDLRGDPGGRLDAAVALVDLFVAGGQVLRTEGRGPGSTRAWRATAASTDLTVPVVVLVDEHSASAAEIVAGSLQDLGRASLVGRPTFGKGTVQSLFRYEDGSALKLTDARWYLPGGRSPAPEAGLVPDVIVPLGAPASAGADPDVAAALEVLRR